MATADLIVSYKGETLEEDAPLSSLATEAGNSKANALVVTVAPAGAVPAGACA